MWDFLVNLHIFVYLILIVVWFMFGFIWWQEGSFAAMKDRFTATENKGILKSMWLGIKVIVLLAVIAFLVNALVISQVKAAELVWFEETTLYAGIDWVDDWSPQCYPETKGYQNLTSNMGFRQSIVRIKDVAVLANYTHHSCAVGHDAYGYDGLGIMLEWRIR